MNVWEKEVKIIFQLRLTFSSYYQVFLRRRSWPDEHNSNPVLEADLPQLSQGNLFVYVYVHVYTSHSSAPGPGPSVLRPDQQAGAPR